MCEGQELYKEIISTPDGRFPEKDAAFVTKQVLLAIRHCHYNNVTHRDLKPENIMIDARCGAVKVIDFGAAHHSNDPNNRMHQKLGTEMYNAPEVYNEDDGYTKACDMWSIGVILFIMLCGFPPF